MKKKHISTDLNTFSVFEYKDQRRFALFREKMVLFITPILKKYSITPNHVTLFGTLFLIPYAYLFSRDIQLAVLALIPYVIFDGLDGAYARVSNQESLGGALSDIIADHLGLVLTVILVINENLAYPALTAYYGFVYIIMISFTVYQNFIGKSVKFIIRSKMILFLGIFFLAYFEKNFLNYLMLIFSIIMSMSCIYSFFVLKNYLNQSK